MTVSDGTGRQAPLVETGSVQGQVVGQDNVVIQLFLSGIKSLPTDYAQRIDNFLTEYLGTSSQPVAFGGRGREIETLDSWLASADAAPYLLLSATAGRGKSALLVRWTSGLLQRADVTVAFIPVSIRYRTNLSGVFFPALAARLAKAHGDEVPTYGDAPAEIWRGAVSEYLARPLPDGRRLLVVLDGLDEAADWVAGADLLPAAPWPGLRVVVSARTTSAMPTDAAWLRTLGWERPGLAASRPLGALQREDVLDIVTARVGDDGPASELQELAAELHRLSEGDPLLISLYLRNLFPGGSSGMPDLTKLAKTPGGLSGYFEGWWADQRNWWQSHFGPQGALQVETQVSALMALFSHALGPLSRDDLTELNPTLEYAIEPALAPVSRFLVGDGLTQGYVFSHSRLGEYWATEHIGKSESRRLEQRFVRYGLDVASSLRARRLSPEDASRYVVQYLGAHLQRSEADAESWLQLVHESWRRAWQFLEGTDTGFLADIRSCRRSLAAANGQARSAGETIPYLAEEIRCVLCENSVIDQTRGISPELLSALVSRRMWSAVQALVYARQIPDPASSAKALLTVAAELPPPSRREVLAEAIEAAFRAANPFTERDLLESVIGRAATLGATSEAWSALDRLASPDAAALVLARLAPYADEQRRAEACELWDSLDQPGGPFEGPAESSVNDWGPVMLAALAAYLPEERQEGAYRRAIGWATGGRAVPYGGISTGTVHRLAGLLPGRLVPELLTRRGYLEPYDRGRFLCDIVPRLVSPLREEVASEAFALQVAAAANGSGTWARDQVAAALAAIAQGYPAHLASLVVDAALRLTEDWPRTEAIIGLLASIRGEQRDRLLTAADELPRHLMKGRVYAAAADSDTEPGDRARHALRALNEAFGSGDYCEWAEMLAALAPAIPQASLPGLVEMADGLQVRTARLTALTALTGIYATRGLGKEALAVVARLKDAQDRSSVLLARIDQLPAAARPALVRQIADAATNADLRWLQAQVWGQGTPIAGDVADAMLASLLGRPASAVRDSAIGSVLQYRDSATPLAPDVLTAVVEVARQSARSQEVASVLTGLAECGHGAEALAILGERSLDDGYEAKVQRAVAVAAKGERADALLAQELAAGVPDGWVLRRLVKVVSAGSVELVERAIPDLRSSEQVTVAIAVAQRLRKERQPDRALRCLSLPGSTIWDEGRSAVIGELIPEASEGTVRSLLGAFAGLMIGLVSFDGVGRIAAALPEPLRIELFERLQRAGSQLPDAFKAAARVAVTLPPGDREPAAQALWSQAASSGSEHLLYEVGRLLVAFLPADAQVTVAAELVAQATRRDPVPETTWVKISSLLPFLRSGELRAAVSVVLRSGATSAQDIAVLSERLAAAGEPGLLRDRLPQAHGKQRQTFLLGLASGADHDTAVAMVTEALQTAQRIGDEGSSLLVLGALAACSAAQERPSLLDRCLRAYRNWTEGADSPAVLEALVPQLDAEDQKSVLISAVARWDLTSDDPANGSLWATVVRLMAEQGLAQTALDTVTAMPAGNARQAAFEALVPALPAGLLDEALKIARSVPIGGSAELRTKLLATVAARLESPTRETVLTEALDAAEDTTTWGKRADAISALPQLTGANLETAVRLARENTNDFVLRPLLDQFDAGHVRDLLPGLIVLPREASAKAVCLAALRLYKLGEKTEGFDLLMTRVAADEVLSVVGDLMPMSPGEAMSRLLGLVRSSKKSYLLPDVICALAPYVSEETLKEFRAEAESMSDHDRAGFYAELARRTSGQESHRYMELALDLEQEAAGDSLLSSFTSDLYAPVARIAGILPVDLAGRAMGVLISAEKPDNARFLKLVCDRIAEFSLQEQFRIVKDILGVVERAHRAQTLSVVRYLLPTLTALGGPTEPARLFNVIEEVISSWP
jgi:hypothetical protein